MSVSAQEAGTSGGEMLFAPSEEGLSESPQLSRMGALGVTALKMFSMLGTTPTPEPPIIVTTNTQLVADAEWFVALALVGAGASIYLGRLGYKKLKANLDRQDRMDEMVGEMNKYPGDTRWQ